MTRIQEGSPVGPERAVALLRGITSPSSPVRLTWAGVADEWFAVGELDYHEDVTIASVLAWAAVREPPGSPVRVDLLDSLQGLAVDGRVPAAALRRVVEDLPRAGLAPAEIEFFDDLVASSQLPAPRVAPADAPNLPGVEEGRPLGPAVCLDLVRGVVTSTPDERRAGAALAAGRAAAGDLDDDEARTLAAVLTWALEVDRTDARPALLAALDALAGRDRVPPWALDRVLTHLDRGPLDPVERGLRADLATALAAHRRRGES
jgi:hypothetical protein